MSVVGSVREPLARSYVTRRRFRGRRRSRPILRRSKTTREWGGLRERRERGGGNGHRCCRECRDENSEVGVGRGQAVSKRSGHLAKFSRKPTAEQ